MPGSVARVMAGTSFVRRSMTSAVKRSDRVPLIKYMGARTLGSYSQTLHSRSGRRGGLDRLHAYGHGQPPSAKSGDVGDYLPPRNRDIRRVFVQETEDKQALWVGSNHGVSVVKVEPLD